jgi:putative membrane protein, TIGR04086 family/integral membrane protein, TIGR04097 family
MVWKGAFFMAEYVQNEEISSYSNGVIPVLKALVLGYLFSMVLFAVLGFLMLVTNLRESVMRPAVLVITLVAMLLTGMQAAKKSSVRGFVIGGVAGLLYMLFLYLIAVLAFSSVPFNLNVLIRFLYAFVAGAVGGVLGRNISAKKGYTRMRK